VDDKYVTDWCSVSCTTGHGIYYSLHFMCQAYRAYSKPLLCDAASQAA